MKRTLTTEKQERITAAKVPSNERAKKVP